MKLKCPKNNVGFLPIIQETQLKRMNGRANTWAVSVIKHRDEYTVSVLEYSFTITILPDSLEKTIELNFCAMRSLFI